MKLNPLQFRTTEDGQEKCAMLSVAGWGVLTNPTTVEKEAKAGGEGILITDILMGKITKLFLFPKSTRMKPHYNQKGCGTGL